MHAPVLAREVAEILRPRPGGRYLDCTLGGGGHSESVLELSGPDGIVLGLDWDEEAAEAARERLKRFGERLIVRRVNFREAKMALADIGWGPVDGVVADLGLSSHHLDSAERGFSFQLEGRLDMRMDRRQALDAAEIVNRYPAADLARIVKDYGEEPRARRIAAAIEAERRRKKIDTTKELADLVARAVGTRPGRTHPATRTFQALRIAVNRELENLEGFLEDAYELLAPQGRMAVISFHSLEDRLVKRAFRRWSQSCLCPPRAPICRCGWSRKARSLTRAPLTASEAELRQNPRARSAKLRAVERI